MNWDDRNKFLLILMDLGLGLKQQTVLHKKQKHETLCLTVGKNSQWCNQPWHCWCAVPYINADGSACMYMAITWYPQCKLA